MLHRFRLAGALALLVGLTGCAEYGYTQRSSYPAPHRAPTYDTGGYDRAPARRADRRVERDAADYAQFVDRNIHLSQSQEYAIRDILVDRAYLALDRRQAYPFPRRDGYARGFWRDADRRIERVLDRYQREYYRYLTRRGERYYRDTYYYDYGYVHYDRFPQRWRSRHDRLYYRSRSRSYRNDRSYRNERNRPGNRQVDRDGNRGRVQGRADHDRTQTRGNRQVREVNDRREQQRAERRQQQQRTERRQQQQRTERRQQQQRTERRQQQQRTERRAERPAERRAEPRTERRAERPNRQRTERGSRPSSNGRSSRGRTSRRDG